MDSLPNRPSFADQLLQIDGHQTLLPAMIFLVSIVLIVFTGLIVILVLLPPLSRIVRWVVVLIVVAVLVIVVVLLLSIAVRLVLVVLTEALGIFGS